MSKNKGHLEVVCGSMFSGKTEELIKKLKRAKFAKKNVRVFKHKLDDRTTIESLHSHNGGNIKAVALDNPKEIPLFIDDTVNLVGIDEVQFYSQDIILEILNLLEQGIDVIVAGLDLDFRGVPFGCMPTLLSIADKVTKLKAICVRCGDEAHFTQRLINDKPAKYSDPIVLVGAQECYQARCRTCFIIDKKYWLNNEQDQTAL